MTSKRNNPKAAPKTYWSILNQFLYNKEIPSIDPLLVNNKFISDFCIKANLFNDFFASICTPINNQSTLPQFAYKTDVKINSFRVNKNDISLIIKTLCRKGIWLGQYFIKNDADLWCSYCLASYVII